MSYTIRVRVIQKTPAKWFSIVERTVWNYANGGTWAENDGELTLTLGGDGTSGTLRFMNPQGDYFLVALGIHDSKRWCDILPDLKARQTAVELHPQYYNGGKLSDEPPKQNAKLSKSNHNSATIEVNYYKDDKDNKSATITVSYMD